MSAAVEAAIEDIPSAGFSLLDYSIEADFSGARHFVRLIVEKMLKTPLGKHSVLNVNIPAKPLELLKGIKVCRQAYAKYEENYVQRNDPHGRQYYWLTGEFQNFDKGKDTDVWALAHNYVSVVPVQYDLTHYTYMKQLQAKWEK
jgi:5'-nucleotidase